MHVCYKCEICFYNESINDEILPGYTIRKRDCNNDMRGGGVLGTIELLHVIAIPKLG